MRVIFKNEQSQFNGSKGKVITSFAGWMEVKLDSGIRFIAGVKNFKKLITKGKKK